MRRRSILLAVLTLAAAGAAARTPARRPPVKSEAACRASVQKFYDSYVRLVDQQHARAPWDRAVQAAPASFSPDLRRWIAVDAAARARQPDDIVGLDFDPFLNSQDPARRYLVKRLIPVKGGYRASVHAVFEGKPSATVSVLPELALRRGRWVFQNFHYPLDGQITDTLDLLTFLRGRDRDRRKGN